MTKLERREFLQLMGLAALPMPSWLTTWSQAFDAEFKLLRNNVGYFTERGGTIGWMSTKDGIVVVDTQFPENAQNCINMLKEESSSPIKLLINTHHHGDHSSGNIAFKGLAEKVVAHTNSKANQKFSQGSISS